MALRIAERVYKITDNLNIPYIFKGSFKSNRSRIDSFTGIGDKTLKILRKVSETFDIPTITDIHEVSNATLAADYVIFKFLHFLASTIWLPRKTGKVLQKKDNL